MGGFKALSLKNFFVLVAFLGVTFIPATMERADGVESEASFIEGVRKKLEPVDPEFEAEGYSDRIQKELEPRPSDVGYTERLKEKLEKEKEKESKGEDEPAEGNYIETKKQRLGDLAEPDAIQAVREGRSELKLKRPGKINSSIGIRVGPSIQRTLFSDRQANTFSTVYPGGPIFPELSVFYEYQLFHSETLGSLGLLGGVGFTSFRGTGIFAIDLPKPSVMGSGNFGTASRSDFRFLMMPLEASGVYRFNLFHYLRPQIKAGAVLMGYEETRADTGGRVRGYSSGFVFSGGVNILMDWLSDSRSWDLYDMYGIKHYYLSIEYTRLDTFGGPLEFAISGIYTGFTFEL